jgi:hypothetical protein
MSLKKKGKYWYGTTSEDIKAEVVRYSALNGYQAAKFRGAACNCGNRSFRLETDEEAGTARRTCAACGAAHWMGDSSEYANEATPEIHECICGSATFQLMSAVALYEGSNDVRWYYIGCQCTSCNLVGVFADWKCEAGDADKFLADT